MRRLIAKGCLLALVVGICALGSAHAQNREAAWELMPFIGTVRFGDATSGTDLPNSGDVNVIEFNDDFSFGFRFGYHYTKKQMVEFSFGSMATDATATLFDADKDDPMTMQPPAVSSTTIQADFLSAQINYVYNFFVHHRDKVVLYVTGGIGVNNLSTFGTSVDPEIQEMLAQLVGEENNFTYNFGGGLRVFANKKVGVRFDVRQVAYEVDATDSDDYLEFQIGLTMILGGP